MTRKEMILIKNTKPNNLKNKKILCKIRKRILVLDKLIYTILEMIKILNNLKLIIRRK